MLRKMKPFVCSDYKQDAKSITLPSILFLGSLIPRLFNHDISTAEDV
jgi:hypothetical protein